MRRKDLMCTCIITSQQLIYLLQKQQNSHLNINGDSQACSHSHFCASEYAVRTVTAVKYES